MSIELGRPFRVTAKGEPEAEDISRTFKLMDAVVKADKILKLQMEITPYQPIPVSVLAGMYDKAARFDSSYISGLNGVVQREVEAIEKKKAAKAGGGALSSRKP